MSDKIYEVLKYLAITGLPVLKIAIPKLFDVWGIPYGEQIGQTLDIVAVALAGLLMVSIANYKNADNVQTTVNTDDVEAQG